MSLRSAVGRSSSNRVLLDRRIDEERMVALHPPFEQPEWAWQICGLTRVPNAFIMDATGAVSKCWIKFDEIDWSGAVAVRLEADWGAPISLSDFDDHEDWA